MPPRLISTLTDAVVDREWLADPVLRAAIRRRVATRLRRARHGSPAEWAERRAELLATRAAGPMTRHADAAIAQHYEVPTEYSQLLLGPWLKYSSGYWPDGVDDLAGAEEAMVALTTVRAGLADGQRVLDLGCGWGAMALWVAARYPGSEVIAVSNSATQRVHIEKQAADRGLDDLCQVVTADVADLAFPRRVLRPGRLRRDVRTRGQPP